MLSINIDTGDFERQATQALREEIQTKLRHAGLTNVQVVITSEGNAEFSGPEDEIKRAEVLLGEWSRS